MICPRCSFRKLRNVASNSSLITFLTIITLIILINLSNIGHHCNSSRKMNPKIQNVIDKKRSLKGAQYSIDVKNYSQIDNSKRDKVKEVNSITAYDTLQIINIE